MSAQTYYNEPRISIHKVKNDTVFLISLVGLHLEYGARCGKMGIIN